MHRQDLIELTAQLKSLVHETLRRLLDTLRMERAQRPESLRPRFGDYERVEEAKFHTAGAPEAVEPERGDPPALYGVTRVVLMPVHPYLVHAYWEVTLSKLEEASSHLGEGRQRTQATLRFYDLTGIGSEDVTGRGSFDVDIDLQARNWYVHLWSPEKSYRVDLGLRAEDGRFVALARSNVVHTPPAGPPIEVEERYLRVEGDYQSVQTVQPAGERSMQPPGGAPARSQPSGTEPPGPAGPVQPPAGGRSMESSGAGEEGTPAGLLKNALEMIRPISLKEILRRILAALFARRTWRQPRSSRATEAPPRNIPARAAGDIHVDLTAMSERKFAFGVFSDRSHPDRSAKSSEPAGLLR